MARPARCALRGIMALIPLLWLTGCGRGGLVREWDVPDEPVQGGRLVLALQTDGRTLDPHRATDAASMRLIENMYGTLMRYTDVYGETVPYLAERVERSSDERAYTFHLRRDVVFHHAHRPMTAADVRFSIERIIDQQVRAEQFRAIKEMETPDPHTLIVRLHEPVAPFLTYLAYPMNAVVDAEQVEAWGGSLDRRVAGTGPFRLREWRQGLHLVMERHPRYHVPGLPRLDEVQWRPLSDETTRTTALRNLEIDGMLDVPDKDRGILERTGYIHIQQVPGTFWEYIGLNNATPPFDDARVRQAVAWAVDRAMINRIVKMGRATEADGDFFPPGHWAWSGQSIYPERNVARARALLDEAGWGDGFETVLKVGSAFPYQVAAAQVVKQHLLAIGVDVTILAQESSVFFDALNQGDFAMTVVGWLGFVDPDEWFYNLFHSEGVWNQQRYHNPEVDRLLLAGRRESDLAARRATYQSIQRLILKDAPVVVLYINEQTSAFLKRVQGFRVHPTGATLALRETWLAPERRAE